MVVEFFEVVVVVVDGCMKHRNADNGIISTFVKLSFLSLSVMRQI